MVEIYIDGVKWDYTNDPRLKDFEYEGLYLLRHAHGINFEYVLRLYDYQIIHLTDFIDHKKEYDTFKCEWQVIIDAKIHKEEGYAALTKYGYAHYYWYDKEIFKEYVGRSV